MDSGFAPDRRSPNLVYEQASDSTSNLHPKQFRPADLPSPGDSSEKTRALQKKVTYLSRTMHHNLQAAMLRGDDLVDLGRKAGELELGNGHDEYRHQERRRRSPSPSKTVVDVTKVDADDEEAIARAMGFGGFATTKVSFMDKKKKKTEYRQILHRKKLYEIPLTRQQAEEKQQGVPPE
ncbi:hypothetical protein PSACC_02144 [Paramicrosporidium saccamoebae]|uniref:U4/U6.U5 small nuclear ribonucleoprotein 27kDa protein domain-containing protein n=1 Tax=Paramicrosporidium saccamoebae TaxID=1246581 RepID=A0A2H9TJS8_9FUNG|nr:hypothetical protein PSACC_02144 [Paramicrosporidium saccamoebae]